MKYILSFFITLSVLCTSLSAVEYGILHFNPVYGELPSSEYKVTLAEGDYLEILSSYSAFGDGRANLILQNGNFPVKSHIGIEGNFVNLSGTRLSPAFMHFVGPCELFINMDRSNYATPGQPETAFINFKLIRASEVEYKNINIVALPSSTVGAGTHEIVVEASDDLQTWTPVHSSSIGGSKAFFRTRVVEAAD